jgi:hypothetical protein
MKYLIVVFLSGVPFVLAISKLSTVYGEDAQPATSQAPTKEYADAMAIFDITNPLQLPSQLKRAQREHRYKIDALLALVEREPLEKGNPDFGMDMLAHGAAIRLLGEYRATEAMPVLLPQLTLELPFHSVGAAREWILEIYPTVDALVSMGEPAVTPILRYVAGLNLSGARVPTNWDIEVLAYVVLKIRVREIWKNDKKQSELDILPNVRGDLLAEIERVGKMPQANGKSLELLTDFVKSADLRTYEVGGVKDASYPAPKFRPPGTTAR